MLSQASYFVTPLALVASPCATCKGTGEIDSPGSFLDALPCACQDAQFNLRAFHQVLSKQLISISPSIQDDTRWPDDIHAAYFGEGC